MRPGAGKIDSEREYFEIDRSVLIGRLNALQLTVRNALIEIEMIAVENVFEKRLSAKLNRKAGTLNLLARRLDHLGRVLARAKYPGPLKSRSRARRRRP